MPTQYIDIPAYGDYHWKAPVATAVDLPATGNTLGDARAAEDTGAIYVWNGSAWITNGGSSGTVTSVGFADGSNTPIFTITGSPVTGSGTITETLNTQTANKVFAGPTSGGVAQPTFRSLVTADLPAGVGTVTSVALADGSTIPIFTITGSPVTGSGTLTETLVTQTANTGFFGPTTGAAAQPAFRAMVTEDLPDPAKYINLVEDFTVGFISTGGGSITAEHNWYTWTSGNSSAYRLNSGSTVPSTAANPGVLQIGVTTNADSASIFTGNQGLAAESAWVTGSGAMSLTFVFKIPTLNNGTDNATTVLGFMDGMPVNGSTNYTRFQYDSSSANWQALTRAGGSTTSTTSATIPVTNAWHKATVSIDAAGANVTYTMDGVVLATHSTNIPTVRLSPGFNIQKSLGSGNALTAGVDLIWVRKTLTTSR